MINSRPLLLGHRGARRSAPENTFTAFDLALAHGCDGFEFDVRCTSDRYAIVCHDPEVAGLPVENTLYSTILQKRAHAAAQGNDSNILPCLEDVTSRYGGRAFLDIELKVAGLEEKVAAAIAPLAANTCVVSSFLPAALQRMHSLQPSAPLGFICDQEQMLVHWQQLPCAVVIAEHKLVTQSLVDAIHGAKKKVFVWTVNFEAEMLLFARAGIDGIISDDTELLGRVFS